MTSREILYEDNHIIAVNKQVSDIVQGDKTGDEPLSDKLKAYIKEKYNKPGNVFLGVVHRIDRPVSGVVLFARTSKALARLNEMIKNRQIRKTYWAIVKNAPPADSEMLEHYLVRDTAKNKSLAYDREIPGSQLAVLSYKVLAKSGSYYCLEIDLQTGRHHQIRAQLAKIGCPIIGDLKYGFKSANTDGGINLHARSLEFIHPVKKEPVAIVAPPPKDELWDDFVLKLKS
jgi:23S rRNA pseudouridine1911/1915/1917 synthase